MPDMSLWHPHPEQLYIEPISNMNRDMDVRNKKYNKWFFCTIIFVMGLIMNIGIANIIVDPYFHYHRPITHYRLYNERYVNDGIARHFDYDAIIIGNSLSQNYKTSQYDELFDAHSVKLPYSGAGVKEIWLALGRAIGRESVELDVDVPVWEYGSTPDDIDEQEYAFHKGYNDDVGIVLVTMDIEDIMLPFYWSRYKDYPKYLYDDNILNDGGYLFNKEVFYRGTLYSLAMTARGEESTTFDNYSSWEHECGKDKVLSYLDKYDTFDNCQIWELTGYEKKKLDQMIEYNIAPVIEANPDVQFMLVLPPRSIAKWAEYSIEGGIDFRIDGMEHLLSELTEYDNVAFYGFDDEYNIVTDFDRFSDLIHYDSKVNEWMISEMSRSHHLITKDNYKEYISGIRSYYSEYDYTSLR